MTEQERMDASPTEEDMDSNIEGEDLTIQNRVYRSVPTTFLRAFRLWESTGSYFEDEESQGLIRSAGEEDEEGLDRKELVRICFLRAFYDRFTTWAALAIALIALLYGATLLTQNPINIQSVGLILDITGAVILASGLLRGVEGILRDTPLHTQSAIMGYSSGYSGKELSATVRDTIDGLFGVSYLIVGFMLQIIAVTI